MASLVSLEMAKVHLGITDTNSDSDVQLKAEQATALVLERCNSTAYWRAITPTWTADTVPQSVQSAILLLLAHLEADRGDGGMASDSEVWTAINKRLAFNRDPVIA